MGVKTSGELQLLQMNIDLIYMIGLVPIISPLILIGVEPCTSGTLVTKVHAVGFSSTVYVLLGAYLP